MRKITELYCILILLVREVYLNQNDEPGHWRNVHSAEEELWEQFSDAEHALVSASMQLSRSVQNVTSHVYKAADNAAILANKIIVSLYNHSHDVMLISVYSTRCVDQLELPKLVQDLNIAVPTVKQCLHDFADMGASLEKEITRIFVQTRAYIIQAKDALNFCQIYDPQPTIYTPCIEKIIKEMNNLIKLQMAKVESIKDTGLNKNYRSHLIVRSCWRRLKKLIARVKNAQKDIMKCRR